MSSPARNAAQYVRSALLGIGVTYLFLFAFILIHNLAQDSGADRTFSNCFWFVSGPVTRLADWGQRSGIVFRPEDPIPVLVALAVYWAVLGAGIGLFLHFLLGSARRMTE